jgi:hypothetical protein
MHLILKPVRSRSWLKKFRRKGGAWCRSIAGMIFIHSFIKICQILAKIFTPVFKSDRHTDK